MPPSATPPASLRLALDQAALAANWRALDALSGTARAGAAVKADGYGLGAERVVPVLRAAGCEDYFVAHWGEAGAIAGLVNPARIAVLHGPLNHVDAAYARAMGIKPVINSLPQARLWLETGGGLCDLMIDTGINRLGLPVAQLGDEAVTRLKLDVLHSHLASADQDSALNAVQLRRWQAARAQVVHARASLANSAGIALGPAYHGDLTRPGLALYGGVPRTEMAGRIRQVARPQAVLIQVRQVSAGEGVGYNSTFIAPRPLRLGVVSLGYADGYLRCWSGKGLMHSQGVDLPVLGRVSMDMTVLDLSAAPALGEGDWVELRYDLPQAMQLSGLSQYELLTLLGRRFDR